MSVLSNLRAKLARSKRYRESFAASVVKRMVPAQIRVLRTQRGWSQAQLAAESNLTQGVISRSEDPEYGNLTLNTLFRIAAGFDCAFLGRFVPFSELGRWYVGLESEKALEVPSFEEDTGFTERKPQAVAAFVSRTQPPLEDTQRQPEENLFVVPRLPQSLVPQRSQSSLGRCIG